MVRHMDNKVTNRSVPLFVITKDKLSYNV
jgi:hypothetical protein